MTSRLTDYVSRRLAVPAAVAVAGLLAMSWPAFAAGPVLSPGDSIVTGFSGVVAPDAPPPATDPLDRTFIDLDGNSVVIQRLAPDGLPTGDLIDATVKFSATAQEVGQVRAIALDDAQQTTGADAPNIYVAATSAYGLNLVVPGPDGNPVRSKTGAADATFMEGQWGAADGAEGYPGSIWRIDGVTGAVSLFTTIADDSGAGIGDLVFDPASQQFFASDLDSGLIYRLAADGTIIDSFDHGVDGRPTHGLSAVADDGSAIDITDPAFDTEDPLTWGITQAERKVTGLGLRGGRLYYAANAQISSVRLNSDGSFGTARWELDLDGAPSVDEVTHIVFDPAGRMILAQRGALTASYDYSAFVAPGTASVLRYAHEFPDDPSTPGTWLEAPETYAIGFASDGANAAGGVALGYGYDKASNGFNGSCSVTLWATGDSLRDDPSASLDPPAQVAGLQGMARSLVRPANDPPSKAFFVDYDGNTEDSEAANVGHVGSVAIWQDCSGSYVAPEMLPPPHYTPPEDYNLSLDKWASPHICFDGGADWWCSFTIRVENTGTVPYWGPVVVDDNLPDSNPGAVQHFWPQPPWSCGPTGPDSSQCSTGPTLLFPGDGIDLHEVVQLPKAMTTACDLTNFASLGWPFWSHDDDASDDFGFANAVIPGAPCATTGSDLVLHKTAWPTACVDAGLTWDCTYAVWVQNAGPGAYSGPITVKDTLGVNAPATFAGPWACGQVGPVVTCSIVAPPIAAPPGWSSGFFVTAHVKKNVGPPLCSLDNKANIALPAGGSPTNALPGNDFDDATTTIADPGCLVPQPHTDLEVTKAATGCSALVYLGVPGYACGWTLTVTDVGPDNYSGPLTFKDASAGATASSLQGVPVCSGPATIQTCVIPSVSLTAGVPSPLNIAMFYPDGPAVCSVTNNVSILAPNPGSPQNPAGNDSSTTGQIVPNPACNFAAPALNIQKTGTGCASDPSSTDWLCGFDIKVTNYGGSPQPAPIVVTDQNDKPTTFTGAACVPSGPNLYSCTRFAPLNAGLSWNFAATSHVDPTGVTLADCDVVNTVKITTPASADPGYLAQASEKVPQLFINVGPGPVAVYCDPPSLKLKKTAGACVPSSGGFDCSFTVNALSTGPDPYHGTVELDEQLPAGSSFKSSDWTCVPTTGNDVHCSSPYYDLAVGDGVDMKITVFVPKAAAARSCDVTNVVNAAISAEVLHSDAGAQYTASATAKLPASSCSKPPACPKDQVKPGGGCCDTGLRWDGKKCVPPVVVKPCAKDSTRNSDGACECRDGTHGTPGRCIPDAPVCARDSIPVDGVCECRDGTHGRPGKCVPDQQVCTPDSHPVGDSCVCDRGTHGTPGRCVPDQLVCAPDSHPAGNSCACNKGTHGTPGRCVPDALVCAPDSHPAGKSCACNEGTHGTPGRCVPDVLVCAPDSHAVGSRCACNDGTHGAPGRCVPDKKPEPKPSRDCPDDSHFDKRAKACVCNPPLVGDPGACTAQILLQPLTIN
ncbi:MAG: hypothetical protein ABI697_04385 [Devosia sp.]